MSVADVLRGAGQKYSPDHLKERAGRRRASSEDAHRRGGKVCPLGEHVDVAEDADDALAEEPQRCRAHVLGRLCVHAYGANTSYSERIRVAFRLLDGPREEKSLLTGRVLQVRVDGVLREGVTGHSAGA